MESRLSDVHSIAGELMRRGEIGQDNAATEGSRIVRVERQPITRGPAVMPAVAPFGMDEEIRKLTSHMEAIRRSVEFTEAQLAVNRRTTNISENMPDMENPSSRGWLVPSMFVANLTLTALLITEIYDGRVGTTAVMLYSAVASMLTG